MSFAARVPAWAEAKPVIANMTTNAVTRQTHLFIRTPFRYFTIRWHCLGPWLPSAHTITTRPPFSPETLDRPSRGEPEQRRPGRGDRGRDGRGRDGRGRDGRGRDGRGRDGRAEATEAEVAGAKAIGQGRPRQTWRCFPT